MKSPFLLCLLASIFALLCIQNATYAQNQQIVREIEIQYAGPSAISRERILANMRTAVGKEYSNQAVEDDIRNLYASGNVQNVRIFGEPLPDGGVKVIVVVLAKAVVTEVQIVGATQVKTRKIRKEISIKPDTVLEGAALEQDRQKILEMYSRRGFTETEVTYDVQSNEELGTAVVIFSVDEGLKTAIRDIRFEGNTAFKDKVLRKQMQTKESNLLSFLTRAGRLNDEKLTADLVTLREFYQNAGYLDVVISEPVVERIQGKKVDLLIPIKEGPVYTVGDINIQGAQVFSTDEVRAVMTLQPGDVFSPEKARDDVKAVQNLYGARGYIDLAVNADTALAGTSVLNVTYTLDEGTETYVERVNISGNTRTKDKVIRRELLVTPGDLYDSVEVDTSKQRLANLNYFERIEIYPTETFVPGRKDLNVLVQEKKTGSFNFGVGFSTIDNLLGFVEMTQSNFDLTNWPNFTGGGQRFRIRVQYGTERKDAVISLVEPWFMDYKLALGGEVFYREATFVSDVYTQSEYGFEINARKPITNFTSILLAYRLENIRIYDVPDNASDFIKSQEGNWSKSSLRSVLSYDSRDSVFLTRRGTKIDLTGYVADGFLGGETKIYGFDLEGAQYFLLPWDLIFLIEGEVGTVDTWAGGDVVPIFDRLYLGGANNLRGFSFRDVGPKDENGEPIGGQSLARLTTELTFPIFRQTIRGAVFFDTGFVNAGSYSFGTSNINSDVGFGVRLNLPIGPIRMDYGIPIKSDPFNDSGGRFNFNIGYQF